MPVAVLFLEAPRTPLVAAASTGIEAAVKIPFRVSGPRGGKSLHSSRGVPGAGETDPRYRPRVVAVEAGPPAFGSDIPGARRPSREQLRPRLSAAEHHGKRDCGAQQTAISHPLPPATNPRITMVVLPPLVNLHHPAQRWQTVFASAAAFAANPEITPGRRGIPATASNLRWQISQSCRVFVATPNNELGIGRAATRRVVDRMSRSDAAPPPPPWRVRSTSGEIAAATPAPRRIARQPANLKDREERPG